MEENKLAISNELANEDIKVEMRKFLMLNGQVFERLTNVEYKMQEHDKKFDEIFNQLLWILKTSNHKNKLIKCSSHLHYRVFQFQRNILYFLYFLILN